MRQKTFSKISSRNLVKPLLYHTEAGGLSAMIHSLGQNHFTFMCSMFIDRLALMRPPDQAPSNGAPGEQAPRPFHELSMWDHMVHQFSLTYALSFLIKFQVMKKLRKTRTLSSYRMLCDILLGF